MSGADDQKDTAQIEIERTPSQIAVGPERESIATWLWTILYVHENASGWQDYLDQADDLLQTIDLARKTGESVVMTDDPNQAANWPIPTTAEDTVRRVIRNCSIPAGRRGVYTVPRWSIVSEVTAHGSGYSSALCRWAGLDPDELVVRRK